MKELEYYINKYKEKIASIQLTSDEELASLISHADESGFSSNSIIDSIIKESIFRRIFMPTLLVGILASLLLMFNQSGKPINQIEEKSKIEFTQTSDKNTNSYKSNNLNTNLASNSIKSEKSEDTPKEYKLKIMDQKFDFSKSSENKIDLPVLILKPEDARKIGIIYDDSLITLTTESKYVVKFKSVTPTDTEYKNIHNNYLPSQILDKKYPGKGVYRTILKIDKSFNKKEEIIEYDNWEMKSSGIYPVSIDIHYFRGSISKGYSRLGCGYSPALKNSIGSFVSQEMDDILQKFFTLLKKTEDGYNQVKISDILYISLDKEEFPLATQLMPVLIPKVNGNEASFSVFWYLPTEKILKLLPEKYSSIATNNFKTINMLTEEGIDIQNSNLQEQNKQFKRIPSNKKITSIEKLVLTSEELKKLGIVFQDNKYVITYEDRYKLDNTIPVEAMQVFYEKGYDTTQKSGIIRLNCYVDANGVKNENIHQYAGWDMINGSGAFPIGVTVYNQSKYYDSIQKVWGERSGLLSSISDHSPLLEKIGDDKNLFHLDKFGVFSNNNMLIPVEVKLKKNPPTEIEIPISSDMNVWFVATEEFANNLPDRYKDSLLKEIRLINSVSDGKMSYEEACKGMPQESFFDFCSSKSGALENLKLYPNPAHNEITCNLNLKEARILNFILYNSNGEYVKTISENQKTEAGISTKKFELDGISAGVYLFFVQSDKNEQIISRMMVK